MQLVTNSNLQNVNYNSNENECNMQSDNREDVVEVDGLDKENWMRFLFVNFNIILQSKRICLQRINIILHVLHFSFKSFWNIFKM